MRAMILAAGLGTRLKPLTDTTPKPLVPVSGRPMIQYALDWFEQNGIKEILINIHHHAEQMEQFVAAEAKRRPGIKFAVQDESDLLLGSGGAIRKASPWLFAKETSAIVFNADSLINADLSAMTKQHNELLARGVLCTLAVMPHPDAGRLYNAFSVNGDLINDHVKADASRKGHFFHFPGLYIIHEQAAKRLENESGSFCIVEKLWKPLMRESKLGAWVYEGKYQDLGTLRDLKVAEAALVGGKFG